MTKVAQTREDILNHLKENIGFLEASNEAFDKGRYPEAKRLATTIRVLVHDTVNSKSILGLLGEKDNLEFLTTTEEDMPGNLTPFTGLVGVRLGYPKVSYYAMLDQGPPNIYSLPKLSFDKWWNQEVIDDKEGGKFTRKKLILALVNKDGGAHVDPELDQIYADLTRNNSVGAIGSHGGEEYPIEDVVLHTVRQISFEIVKTLNEHGFYSD